MIGQIVSSNQGRYPHLALNHKNYGYLLLKEIIDNLLHNSLLHYHDR